MTRDQVGRLLAAVACLGFLGTAGLHSTGYDSAVRLGNEVPGVMGEAIPMLWLGFSFDLAVLGLIIGVLVARPRDVARPILAIAALCPFSAAGLQLAFIGFVPPTAILIVLGVVTWAGAVVWSGGVRVAHREAERSGSGRSQ